MLEDWQQSSHVYPTQYSRAQARPGQTQRDSRSRNRPGLNQPKTWYRLVTLKLIFINLQSNNSDSVVRKRLSVFSCSVLNSITGT